MHIRIECTLPGLEGNWIDLSDTWSRAEIMAFYPAILQGNDEVTLPLLQRKLSGVHLHLIDGALVTCLLYTSPSPRDRTRSRMPSSA